MAVATDDMVVMSKKLTNVNWFKDQIKTFWEISDMADISWYLSFEVKCDRNARMISINQRRYIKSIAERYGLSDVKPVTTPMEPGLLLDQHAEEGTERTHHIAVPIPYAEAIGSILWAGMVSRPDVMFAISVLVQFMHQLKETHWKALKRVIIYLHTTEEYSLTFGGGSILKAIGYCDANWGGQSHSHSILGYSFHMGMGAVIWSSKKQYVVALSSIKAE